MRTVLLRRNSLAADLCVWSAARHKHWGRSAAWNELQQHFLQHAASLAEVSPWSSGSLCVCHEGFNLLASLLLHFSTEQRCRGAITTLDQVVECVVKLVCAEAAEKVVNEKADEQCCHRRYDLRRRWRGQQRNDVIYATTGTNCCNEHSCRDFWSVSQRTSWRTVHWNQCVQVW